MKRNILFVIITVIALFACKKEDKQNYESRDNIYLNYANKDTIIYSFAYVQGTDKDTVLLPVIVSGKRVNYDRKFVLTVVDTSTTAMSDLHYEPLKSFYILPADSGTIKIPLILKNTDTELANKSVLLTVRISGGEDFDTNLPVVNRTKSVIFSNRLEKPLWWDQWGGDMKAYSRVKHQLFLISSGTIDLPDRSAPDSYLLTPRALFHIQNTRLFLDDPMSWVEQNSETGYVVTERTDGTGDYDFYSINSPNVKFHLKYYPNVGRYIFLDENGNQILL